MASYQSKVFRFILKNRHWFKGHLTAPVIDRSTSMAMLREDVRRSAARMSRMPAGISVVPSDFPHFYGEWIVPEGCDPEKLLLYFHGSGFVMGTSRDHRGLVAKFADRCGVKALVFDYSLAPEHPYPAAIEDALSIYSWLLDSGYKSENIIFVGDSAGACIALSTLLRLKNQSSPFPKATVALSPCTDLTCSGDSHRTKADIDPATPPGATETYTAYYIGASDPSSPLMSPLFAELEGLPPMMIQVGEDETLLDDSLRFAKKAQLQGVDVTLRVWEGMFHCFPLLSPLFPEAVQAMDEIAAFIAEHLSVKKA